MEDAGALSDEILQETLESNGLDLIAQVAPDGTVERYVGEEPPTDLASVELAALLEGRADESVYEQPLEHHPLHVSAAVRRSNGGAMLVRTHADTAYAFAQRLGVQNLLEHFVGEGTVLYVAYIEDPGGVMAEATWDGGPLPVRHAHSGIEEVRDHEAFEVVVEVPTPAGRSGAIHVGFDAAQLHEASRAATLRTILVGLVLAAFGIAGTGFALVQRQRQREREEAALQLSAAEDRRRQSERLASAGALAAGVAHEVRNPLNAISISAQRLERCEKIGDCCAHLATAIRTEVRRLDDIVRGFLDLARPTFGPRETADAIDIVRDVVHVLQPETDAHAIRVFVERDGDTTLSMDCEAVRRAVLNLVRNAVQASAEGDEVRVRVEGNGTSVRVRVDDRGHGLDPQIGTRAFDPFVTGRAGGTGLGLALVRRVAEDHGGWASLEPREGGGVEAVFEMRRGAST
jgi:signal transduction histidine kinase